MDTSKSNGGRSSSSWLFNLALLWCVSVMASDGVLPRSFHSGVEHGGVFFSSPHTTIHRCCCHSNHYRCRCLRSRMTTMKNRNTFASSCSVSSFAVVPSFLLSCAFFLAPFFLVGVPPLFLVFLCVAALDQRRGLLRGCHRQSQRRPRGVRFVLP